MEWYFGALLPSGLYELDLPPVDLSTAIFQEIADSRGSTDTKNCKKTLIYNVYKNIKR